MLRWRSGRSIGTYRSRGRRGSAVSVETAAGCSSAATAPPRTDEVPVGRPGAGPGQAYHVVRDDEVERGEADEVLPRDLAGGHVPLRDPDPTHDVSRRAGRHEPMEHRQAVGVEDAA